MTAPGVRSTRQRAAISALLETVEDFRSAQELHDALRERGENIGLTTVYRTLQAMATAGHRAPLNDPSSQLRISL